MPATPTRPRLEQIRFTSSKTGTHNIDTYLESAEIGDRTLASLLADLFDENSNGDFRSDIFDFRSNDGQLQFRVGTFTDPEAGWQDVDFRTIAGKPAVTFPMATEYPAQSMFLLGSKLFISNTAIQFSTQAAFDAGVTAGDVIEVFDANNLSTASLDAAVLAAEAARDDAEDATINNADFTNLVARLTDIQNLANPAANRTALEALGDSYTANNSSNAITGLNNIGNTATAVTGLTNLKDSATALANLANSAAAIDLLGDTQNIVDAIELLGDNQARVDAIDALGDTTTAAAIDRLNQTDSSSTNSPQDTTADYIDALGTSAMVAKLVALHAIITEINALASRTTAIDDLGGRTTEIDALYNIRADIDAIGGTTELNNISTVAGLSSTDLAAVASAISPDNDIQTVADNIGDVNTVANAIDTNSVSLATGGSYDSNTGITSFTFTDSSNNFSTTDLRGADGADGTNGADGDGFTGGSYNTSTGVVTFTSDDGLGFSTSDLRGATGAAGADGDGFTGGSYNSSNGIVTFTSDDGLGFSTGDLRGADGTNGVDGDGFTGGSYNSTTGVVTFTSNDGLGFSTTDLRGADGTDGTNGTNGTDGDGFTGGSYNASNGIVTFTSNDGLGFSTGDLRGATGATGAPGTNGTDGTGFTGGSYNSSTGVVTFTSDDGLGFSTTDLRGADGSDATVNTANVRTAGALMDDELADLASVKLINQGLATTDDPEFAGLTIDGNITVSGTVDGVDIAALNTTVGTKISAANLAFTTTATAGTVTNDAGSDASLSAATTSNAGLMVAADKSKLDAINQTLSTTSTPTFATVDVTTELRVSTIDPDPDGVDDAGGPGTLVILGNLQVDGETTTINSTNLAVDDLNITVASGAANAAAANGAGITVDGANATLQYASSTDRWEFDRALNVAGNITVSGTVDGVDIAALNTTVSGKQATLSDTSNIALNTLTTQVGGSPIDVRRAKVETPGSSTDLAGGARLYSVATTGITLTMDDTALAAGDIITIYANGFDVTIAQDATNGFDTVKLDGTTTAHSGDITVANGSVATISVISTTSGSSFAVVAGQGLS